MLEKRPKCAVCRTKPRAFNYVKEGQIHYRSRCLSCEKVKKKEQSLENQSLLRSGYLKRHECDRCHFQSKHPDQLSIVYLDGNRLNAVRTNLRTYCANCVAEITAMPKSKGGLVADF